MPLHLVEADLASGALIQIAGRGCAAGRPHHDHVGHLSNRQSAGPGGTLVHRAPQTRGRTAVERDDGSIACLARVGSETPAIICSPFARQEKETEPLMATLACLRGAASNAASLFFVSRARPGPSICRSRRFNLMQHRRALIERSCVQTRAPHDMAGCIAAAREVLSDARVFPIRCLLVIVDERLRLRSLRSA